MKTRLFTPGPTPVPQDILLEMAKPITHHRLPEFEESFAKVNKGLKYLFQTRNDVYTLTSSGTGGMEAIVANLLKRGDHELVVRTGKFGERWGELCKAYGIDFTAIDVEWGKSVDPQQIYDALSGNIGFDSFDMVDFEGCAGSLPEFAAPSAAWYISRVGFFASMARLMDAAGGTTSDQIAGGTALQFLGYPVRISQLLDTTTGDDVSVIKCLFGDLRLASTLGDRRGITAATTLERYFELEQIGIKATQRYDIQVHDLGDNTDAGPLVALKTAAS